MWAVGQPACRQAVSREMDRPLKRDSALRRTDSLQRGSPPGDGTYEMASIMSMPISTQQWAWSALASGSPETQ